MKNKINEFKAKEEEFIKKKKEMEEIVSNQ